ncbi:[NiFe]-hydrogenase assembly chaperone HybE [Halomonas sp. LS-001]
MQLLTPAEYAEMAELASHYRDLHLSAMKQQPVFNPRLGVDALCCQRCELAGLGDSGILGALITPCALWLVALPDDKDQQGGASSQLITLPSGTYRFDFDALPNNQGWYMCQILDELSDMQTMQEAAQLAQRLMERIMAPMQ